MRTYCNYKFAALIAASGGLLLAALLVCGAGPSAVSADGARASADGGHAEPVTRARWLMGTLCIVRAFGEPEAAGAALDAALDRIEDLEQTLTTWRPDGELARLNERCAANGATAAPVPVSADLFRALALASEWAARTGGAFDPTVGALADAWGLRTGGSEPSPGEITTVLAAKGDAGVTLDPALRTVRCAAGVRFDLGGIGKGLALDEAAAVLRRSGVTRALLDFGGQLLALEAPPGRAGWPVEVPGWAAPLLLRDASVAASGNTERGRHVLDPATGRAVVRDGTLSVHAPSAAAADALSTALFVAGPAGAARIAPPGVRYVFASVQPAIPPPSSGAKGPA